MGLNPHRRAAQRLYDGTTWTATRAARWAARNKTTATLTAVAAGVAVPDAIHRDPRLAAGIAAAWAWTAWRATPPPDHNPNPSPEPVTSGDSGQEEQPTPVGEGMTIIKTVRGTATTHPHPDQPHKTLIRWDKT